MGRVQNFLWEKETVLRKFWNIVGGAIVDYRLVYYKEYCRESF